MSVLLLHRPQPGFQRQLRARRPAELRKGNAAIRRILRVKMISTQSVTGSHLAAFSVEPQRHIHITPRGFRVRAALMREVHEVTRLIDGQSRNRRA